MQLLRTRSSLKQMASKNINVQFTHLYIPSMCKEFFVMPHNLGHPTAHARQCEFERKQTNTHSHKFGFLNLKYYTSFFRNLTYNQCLFGSWICFCIGRSTLAIHTQVITVTFYDYFGANMRSCSRKKTWVWKKTNKFTLA